MKQIFISFLLLSAGLSFSQVPQNWDPSYLPQIGKISGIVEDAFTGNPVEFATVTLMAETDSVVINGTVTDAKGKFSLAELPAGHYFIEATFIGYEKFVVYGISINPKTPEITLQKISLNMSEVQLTDVIVAEEKSDFTSTIDKKIFNVEKNLISQGGNANDVLNQIPSVSVDMDNKISMRGSENVKILIDGKPSTLEGSLQSIPASSIESIELITNPSAKYDPDGMSGIINIVLKKNHMQGLSGLLSASAGTGDNYNLAGTLNYRTKKLNLFSNYGFNFSERDFSGETYRETYSNDSIFVLNQTSNGNNIKRSHMIRAGADYTFNDHNSISLSGTYHYNFGNRRETIDYSQSLFEQAVYDHYSRRNEADEPEQSVNGALSYKHFFGDPKQTLTVDFNYSGKQKEKLAHYEEQQDSDFNPSFLQNNNETEQSEMFSLQSDFSYPFKESKKFEAGVKASLNSTDTDVYFETFDSVSESYFADTLLINRFVQEEQVFAGYVTFAASTKYFGYQFGLRAEQVLGNSELVTTGEKFDNDYFSLFPSAHIKHALGKGQDIKLSYSRRVNRPWGFSMNPFPDRNDPVVMRIGNPLLQPEYVNSFELSYSLIREKLTLTSALYYRKTQNMVTRFTQVENGVSISKPLNLGIADAYGVELFARWKILDIWSVSGNFNFYQSFLKGEYEEVVMNNEGFGWSAKGSTNLTLPGSVLIQISGNYNSPVLGLQGEFKPRYSVDAGVRKDLFKNKASLSLNVTDIFDTQKFGGFSQGENFYQEITRKRESRIATLTFSWFFGNQDSKKKEQNENRMNNVQGGEDF